MANGTISSSLAPPAGLVIFDPFIYLRLLTVGVDTNELSAKTKETRKVPGLFCIGEVVDVTGQLGGFNFRWA
jgi:hypothetical protein